MSGIDDLGQLADRLADMASVPSRAAKGASERIVALIEEEFAGQHDPYGKPWKAHAEATVERWGEHPIHDLTGDEKSGVEVRPMAGAGIAVTFDTDYTKFNEATRPILPQGNALPASWDAAIGEACAEAASRVMR